MTQPVVSTTKLADGSNNGQIGERQAAIADITPAADGTTAGTAVNSVLAVLRAHGLIAD